MFEAPFDLSSPPIPLQRLPRGEHLGRHGGEDHDERRQLEGLLARLLPFLARLSAQLLARARRRHRTNTSPPARRTAARPAALLYLSIRQHFRRQVRYPAGRVKKNVAPSPGTLSNQTWPP